MELVDPPLMGLVWVREARTEIQRTSGVLGRSSWGLGGSQNPWFVSGAADHQINEKVAFVQKRFKFYTLNTLSNVTRGTP